MRDLETTLRRIDSIPEPDVWPDVERRAESRPLVGVEPPAPRPRASSRIAAATVALAVFAAAGVLAWQALRPTTTPQPTLGTNSTDASRILAAINSPRVTSLSRTDDSTALVQGHATSDPGDVARTLWYETLGVSAFAQTNGLPRVEEVVLDPSGKTLDSEADRVSATQPDPFSPLSLTSSDIESSTTQAAQSLGARVVDVHYIALYGGTAEVVIQPDDPTTFVASASSKLSSLLGRLGQDHGPYLVTVVDSSGAPQLILGFTPGLGGSFGTGLGWVAPGLKTDAIFGQPVVLPSAAASG